MSNTSSDRGGAKRSLPSWMSSKQKGSNSRGKKQDGAGEGGADHVKGKGKSSAGAAQSISHFSELLDGVVFVLSGFVNPERSTLRSQALEMGAEYRPDWTSDCTLLICAFPNTPKFRQVESDCGTIVSKEWISECYNQKKLVDIDRFLLHAGKPWRTNSNEPGINKGKKDAALHEEPRKQLTKSSAEKRTETSVSKGGLSDAVMDHFSPSKLKEWAIDDLRKTVSWLESQDEKPEASEVKAIAAQGIITCLQDAIESLKQNKDIRLVMEQWMFIPHVVKELAGLETGRGKRGPLSKEELSELAVACKKSYESEFDRLDTSPKKKQQRTNGAKDDVNVEASHDDSGFDSDQTIEMTEEEIDFACKQLTT